MESKPKGKQCNVMGKRLHQRFRTRFFFFFTLGSTTAEFWCCYTPKMPHPAVMPVSCVMKIIESDNKVWHTSPFTSELRCYIRLHMLWDLWTKGILEIQIIRRYFPPLTWKGKVLRGAPFGFYATMGDFYSDGQSVFVFPCLPFAQEWVILEEKYYNWGEG